MSPSLADNVLYVAKLPDLQSEDSTAEGHLRSIAVEPSFLARVAEAQRDASDCDMQCLVRRTRGSNAAWVIRSVHGYDLVYRVGVKGSL